MRANRVVALTTMAIGVLSAFLVAQGAQPPSPDQIVAGLKQNLAESQKRLRQYEWIETTIISLKGEEKARKQARAYYGADGKLTKVPMGTPPAKPEQGGGGAAAAAVAGSRSRSSRTRKTRCRTTWKKPAT